MTNPQQHPETPEQGTSATDDRPLTYDNEDKPISDMPYPPLEQPRAKQGLTWVILALVALVVGIGLGRYWGATGANTAVGAETASLASSSPDDAVEGQDIEAIQKPVLTVETVAPTPTTITNQLTAEGTIQPKTTASVNGKINGVAIDQVLVEEGDSVQQGQVLAVFDTDAIEQRLIQGQAELAEAQNQYELAKKEAERILPLIDINAISQQEADRYKASANSAGASMAAARARLNNQMLELENAQVIAPVGGIISQKNADVGSVPSGQSPLFTIIKDGQLEWQAQIDPNNLGAITVGTPVAVSLPNNQSVMGRVSRIAPTAQEGSRQITVYALLAPNPIARPGMYQQGVFALGSTSQMTIPVSAVVTEDGYDYVMQIKAVKNAARETVYRVHRVKVELGERHGDTVALLAPLSGEGQLVRQGGSFLNDGDIVRVVDVDASISAQQPMS